MLEQVSGRAGRTGSQGEVMIQTFNPKNPVFEHLKAHDYEGLYKQQIAERELFKYPPYQRLIMLTLRHRDLGRLDAAATLLQQRLQQSFGDRVSGVIIPAVTKVSNLWVRQIRLRVETNANIARAKTLLKEQILFVQQQEKCKGTIILPDVDPM
jgi:primosomal protein N' (replication factor Y)